jgi:hypothetical protein
MYIDKQDPMANYTAQNNMLDMLDMLKMAAEISAAALSSLNRDFQIRS